MQHEAYLIPKPIVISRAGSRPAVAGSANKRSLSHRRYQHAVRQYEYQYGTSPTTAAAAAVQVDSGLLLITLTRVDVISALPLPFQMLLVERVSIPLSRGILCSNAPTTREGKRGYHDIDTSVKELSVRGISKYGLKTATRNLAQLAHER